MSVTNKERATWNIYVVNGNNSFKYIDVGRQVDIHV